jgi:putative transposase
MQRFKLTRHALGFLFTHSRIHIQFQLRRHLISAAEYRYARAAAFCIWRGVAGVTIAA